jgi:hypothetical protein
MPEFTVTQTGCVKHFWEFVDTCAPLHTSEDSAVLVRQLEQFTYEGTALLRVLDRNLSVSLGMSPVGGPVPGTGPELIISADGIRGSFHTVFMVVELAPARVRERFNVRALRPLNPSGGRGRVRLATVDGQAVVVDAENILVTTHQVGNRLDITFFLDGYDSTKPVSDPVNDAVTRAVLLLCDHLIGEFATATCLGSVDFHNLVMAPVSAKEFGVLLEETDALAAHGS